MTFINAVPHPDTASVTLTITPSSVASQIMRTDANGTNPVRTLAGLLPAPASVEFVVTDYEAAIGTTVEYTVIDETVGAATSTLIATAATWLTLPIVPQYNTVPELVTGLTSTRPSATTVHTVIGRSDPVPSLGRSRLRSGTMTVWCASYADAAAVAALYANAEVVQLRQVTHPGLDMYHVATAVAVDTDVQAPIRWSVSVDYTEVRIPSGPLLGALGWTYDDVTATYSTYLELSTAFATYNDLEVGP